MFSLLQKWKKQVWSATDIFNLDAREMVWTRICRGIMSQCWIDEVIK